MAIAMELKSVPPGCRTWQTTHTWEQTGSLEDVPYWQLPFVKGDLYQVRGWLEGLGGSAIGGFMEFVLHEGYTTATGQIEIYNKRTQYNVELLTQMMNRVVHGITTQFPKTHFRMKVTYETAWSA